MEFFEKADTKELCAPLVRRPASFSGKELFMKAIVDEIKKDQNSEIFEVMQKAYKKYGMAFTFQNNVNISTV